MKKIWIGLDIGGTRIKCGAIDGRGRVITRNVELTKIDQDLDNFERQLDKLVADLLVSAQGTLAGIGASITGIVDPEIGCVYLPGKIRGLDRHKTVPYLRRRWRVPVVADNDGRLACFAEWRAGAGRRQENLLVFTLGTGIGSGAVVEGQLLTDRHFLRGSQCGHAVIDPSGPRCLTGPKGTGESIASITALVLDVRSALVRGLGTTLDDRPRDQIAFPEIAEAVRRGDPVVTDIFDRWLERFGLVVLNAYYAYTPDLIVLAGGPTRAADLFLPKLARQLNALAFRLPKSKPIPVQISSLGEDAGWIGAALMARKHGTIKSAR